MRSLNALILNFLIFIAFQVNAQRFPSQIWHPGELTLEDRSVIKGSIKYDFERETVQIQVGETTQTYDASQVLTFNFFDQVYKGKRVIYALPYTRESGYVRPTFFEVIVEGKMTFLVREYLVTQAGNTPTGIYSRDVFNPYPYNSISQTYLAYNMYFVEQDGVINQARSRRKDIVNQFEGNHAELKKYIKGENLKLERLDDVAKLVEYYNNELSN